MHWLELIIHSTSTFGVSSSILSMPISNEKILHYPVEIFLSDRRTL